MIVNDEKKKVKNVDKKHFISKLYFFILEMCFKYKD
jgi:hypothetical protein